MRITFDYLVKKLGRKTKIDQINENEYIITKDERTGQEFLLLVLQTDNLRDTVREVSHKIENDYVEAEKKVTQFGIIFSSNYVVFLRYKSGSLVGTQVQKLKKDLKKINRAFLSKFNDLIKNPEEMTSWEALYDRTDMIEEFYKLYSKAKNNLLENIKGIYDDIEKQEYADNLLMQLLVIWYLQEKGFLDNDKNYLINHFKDYGSLGFSSYYSFLKELFDMMMGNEVIQYFHNHTNLGNIIVTGPAPFINGNSKYEELHLSDKIFYKDEMTKFLIQSKPENISEVPILNLFASRDWTEGNIDEYVLGAIYEKLMTRDERKKTGAFYTPEDITNFICQNTIIPFLIAKINRNFEKKYSNLDQMFEEKDEELLDFFFKSLKSLKILDPAVGSAHFLETAIETLLRLYERLYLEAQEINLKNGLEIIFSNESGILEKVNLLNIEDIDHFRIYVKFFIILSKNIYGVDANPSALKVAKARLFLSLAKHFDIEKNVFIKFPNIHFNLRIGNSLIGFRKLEFENKMKQFDLQFFITANEKKEISKNVYSISKLKGYISNISKKLSLNFDFEKSFSKINTIFLKKELKWNEFKYLLSVKQKLIKILIISLNSKYAIPLNKLINKITNLFNHKLDSKFNKENDFNENQIDQIRQFHWIFEFPEVILENKGFDIIIGNPPYLSSKEIPKYVKKYLRKLYITSKGQFDLYSIFIERSYHLLCKRGYFGFIIADSFLGRSSFEPIREFLLDKISFKEISRISGVFEDPSVANAIIIFRNIIPKNNDVIFKNFSNFQEFETHKGGLAIIPQEFFESTYKKTIRFVKEEYRMILEKLSMNNLKFGKIIKIHRGEELGKTSKEILTKFEKGSKKIIFGEDIQRYVIDFSNHYINKEEIKKNREMYFSPALLIRQLGDNLNVAYDKNGTYVTLQSIYNIIIRDPDFNPIFLLGILNSKLMNFYYSLLFKKELFPRILLENIEEFPIPKIPKNEQEKIVGFVEKLILLKKFKKLLLNFWENSYKELRSNTISLNSLIKSFKEGEKSDYILSLNYYVNKNKSEIIDKEFESFEIKLKNELILQFYGRKDGRLRLLLEIRSDCKKHRDILYLDIIKLFNSRKKVLTLDHIFKKSRISIVDNKEWKPNIDLINYIYEKNRNKNFKQNFKVEIKNITKLNKKIQELENFIEAYTFHMYNLNLEEVKSILDYLKLNPNIKSDIIQKLSKF